MGPIPSNANEAARLTMLLEDTLLQSDYVDDILRNLPEFTKSRTQPPNPATSRALARIPIPEVTTVPNLPHTYGIGEVPVHELVKQQAARQAEAEILRAAAALNAPMEAPRAPARPPPRGVPRMRPTALVGRMMNPLLTLLQGALWPTDLNEEEEKELAERRKGSAANDSPPSARGPSKPDRN